LLGAHALAQDPTRAPSVGPVTAPILEPATAPGDVPITAPGNVPATVPADVPATATADAPVTDEPALDQLGGTPRPATRFETQLDFKRLVEEQRFTDALAIGDELLALTAAEFGETSVQTAEAYAQLADAQRRAKEHSAAEENFHKSVDVYRKVDGAFSPLAIAPLTGLGDNYQDGGDYLNAVSAYSEARTISRRVYGLLNENQIELLDRMTVSLVSLNQPLEADQQQLEALRLVERNWPPESKQGLGGIYKYAGWLRESGRYQEEREQYMRALRIIRDTYGKDDPQQVRALVGIGNSFRNQRIPEGQGVSALRDALALLLAERDSDSLAIAEVLRDLGDWEIAFNKVGYDGAEYRRAWQLLGEVDNGESLRNAWFTGPAYVLREPISQRGLSQEQDAPAGHVLVKFDLDAMGRSVNVVIVESEPPGFKDESVLRHVRRSRFRPQMANGELVPGAELALQFNYRYTPDELTNSVDGEN
jgi:tetratricopeptide (TPR) repeat protein